MLVLSRKCEESIKIGDHIVITMLKIRGGSVRLGIQAPTHIRVLRTELLAATERPSNQLPPPLAVTSVGSTVSPRV